MAAITGSSIEEIREKLKRRENNAASAIQGAAAVEDAETLAAISDTWEICGMAFPAPSLGSLMILQLADCPFLSSENAGKITLKQIVETLFVMKNGRGLLKYFIAPKRRGEYIARAEKLAEKSPEMFAEYLKGIGGDAMFDEYDRQLAEYAFSVPHFDIQECAEEIDRYLGLCLSGLAAVENDGSGSQKKKTVCKMGDESRILPFKRD